MKYPDTSKPYTIFTDASKYDWAGFLTQEHTSVLDGKEVTANHPVSFVSGMFCGSQLNWAAMTKEAYAIYMTVKKSTFFLTGQEITLRSDHLPLKKFLNHRTLNNTVDNWAVEIESFKIKFVHIAGKDIVLADTLSRLINIDPDVEQEPELKEYKFGCYAFETLPEAEGTHVSETLALVDGVDICEINISYDNAENSQFSVKLPLSDTQFSCLQEKYPKIRSLHEKVHGGFYTEFYFIENDILYRFVMDNGHKFSAAVMPEDLTGTVLVLGHNQSGHNGYQRTYAAIKQSYYCKRMRKHVLVHCKTCVTCANQKFKKHNLKNKYLNQVCSQWSLYVLISLVNSTLPHPKVTDMH